MNIEEMYNTAVTWRELKDQLESKLIEKQRVSWPFSGSAFHYELDGVNLDGTAEFHDKGGDLFYPPVKALIDDDPASWKNWCEAETARRELAAHEARERFKLEREEAERRTLDEILRRHPEWANQ